MKKVIETIKSFFKKNEWKYLFNEEDNIFTAGINMGNVLGNVKLHVLLGKNSYTVYTIFNSKVEEKYYAVVGEYLHRANFGLKNGNFEMDYNDGEIRYKVFVNFKSIDISEEIVEDSMVSGAIMFDRYGKELIKIMLDGGTPKECIEKCEDVEK